MSFDLLDRNVFDSWGAERGVAHGSDRQDDFAKEEDDAEVEDGLEHAEVRVCQDGADNGGEVAESGEGVEENGGGGVAVPQEPEVETEDGWNWIELSNSRI